MAITIEEENAIIALYNQGVSCQQISKQLGRYRTFAYDYLKKRGLNTGKDAYSKLTNEEVESIRSLYVSGETAEEIRQTFSDRIRCPETICKIIKDGGIQKRPATRFTIIRKEDFFEKIDSEDKAYILGFLLSDGYITAPRHQNGEWQWGIGLKESDEYILEYIKNAIGIERKRICHNNHLSVLTVTSNKMVNDLAKYTITSEKSFSVQFPYVQTPIEMHRHIIRGFFDGNGCVSKPNCTFYGNKDIVTSIRDILSNEAKMTTRRIYYNDTCYVYSFSFSRKSDLELFGKYVYDGASIWLKRKREKFELLQLG